MDPGASADRLQPGASLMLFFLRPTTKATFLFTALLWNPASTM